MKKILKLNSIFESKECQNYVKQSKKLALYFKNIENNVEQEKIGNLITVYKKALLEYRKFLDKNNIFLPVEIYPYKSEQKNTHKYSKSIVKDQVNFSKSEKTRIYCASILNPDWIYKKKEKAKIANTIIM